MSQQKTYPSDSTSSFIAWLSMRVSNGRFPTVSKEEITSVQTPVNTRLIQSSSDIPRVTWVGHATILMQYKGINFLTDPHLSNRAGPVDVLIPTRLTPPAITYEDMPNIDFIVISHNHYDHLDHRTVDMFGNSVLWYVPKGLKAWFVARDIDPKKVVELDWWESHPFNQEVTVTFTPSVHWSKRSPWDTNQSHWGSWSVKIDQINTWFAGDTAYDKKVFEEIGKRTGPYDLAFIPIGAYAPVSFMGNQHISPKEAVKIHQDIRATQSIPIHWATFQLTHEPFLEPPQLLASEMAKAGLALENFNIIKIGETVVYPLNVD